MRVGVDVGGTFTDAVLMDEETGEITRTKVLTTAHDQSEGTLAAIKRLAGDPSKVTAFHHGYTVGVNAALTRKGAPTGMIVTAGHRDLVDIGRLWRPFDENLYDPSWRRPHEERPLVPRRHRREVPERMREDGTSVVALDEDEMRRQVEFLKAEGIESVGICFIHGYEHPAHEQRAREIVEEMMPDAYVQTSAIWPLAREFERTFVVMLDAVTGPPVVRYLERLEERLRGEGFDSRIEIMQVDGGLRTSDSVRKAPIYTLQSGPVAGLLGAELYSRELLGGRDLVCLDIGGTSADLGVIIEQRGEVTNEWQLEHGIPLSLTMLDVRSIGAGGGSLIGVDEVGSILVGPESAGSEPGPACYGRGGTNPAMTDAYVALGLLQPDLFLGGEMNLDAAAAEKALDDVGEPLGMSGVELAEGAYQIANTKLAAAVKEMTIARGLDPRTFSLFGYGAAGGMHAAATAQEVGIGEVIIPYFPGGFSAFGMTVSRSRIEHSQAVMKPLVEVPLEEINAMLERLADTCRDEMREQGHADDDIEILYSYYGMYAGQGNDNRLPLPKFPLDEAAMEVVAEEFHDYYDRRFGYRAPEVPIFLTSLAAVAIGPSPNVKLPDLPSREDQGGKISDAVIRTVKVRLEGGEHDAAIYDRRELLVTDEFDGPAVIDDQLGTIVIPVGARVSIGAHGTLHIHL
jgi:N-methylhydantoinase A